MQLVFLAQEKSNGRKCSMAQVVPLVALSSRFVGLSFLFFLSFFPQTLKKSFDLRYATSQATKQAKKAQLSSCRGQHRTQRAESSVERCVGGGCEKGSDTVAMLWQHRSAAGRSTLMTSNTHQMVCREMCAPLCTLLSPPTALHSSHATALIASFAHPVHNCCIYQLLHLFCTLSAPTWE
jgi:hypothetical protein